MLCAFICNLIKFNAIAVQQKVFGELMGKCPSSLKAVAFAHQLFASCSGSYISVRRFVGVNSVTIRAVKKILSKPGMSLEKVFILVGGPDWPTSVLTGILRLSLSQVRVIV